MIASGLLTSFLGAWLVIQVRACKSKDTTTPPPPVCADGDTIEDDFVVETELNKQHTMEDAESVVPSTVYVEVMVVIDRNLREKVGKTYKNGRWDPTHSINTKDNALIEAEVQLYTRKFLSAVNIKFQGQFKNPKIKFVLREAFKSKAIFKRSVKP